MKKKKKLPVRRKPVKRKPRDKTKSSKKKEKVEAVAQKPVAQPETNADYLAYSGKNIIYHFPDGGTCLVHYNKSFKTVDRYLGKK